MGVKLKILELCVVIISPCLKRRLSLSQKKTDFFYFVVMFSVRHSAVKLKILELCVVIISPCLKSRLIFFLILLLCLVLDIVGMKLKILELCVVIISRCLKRRLIFFGFLLLCLVLDIVGGGGETKTKDCLIVLLGLFLAVPLPLFWKKKKTDFFLFCCLCLVLDIVGRGWN